MLDLFIELENGQLEINWENLELLVPNKDFIEELKYYVTQMNYSVVSFKKTKRLIRVTLSFKLGFVRHYSYLFSDDIFTVSVASKYDLEEMVKAFGGAVSWNQK